MFELFKLFLVLSFESLTRLWCYGKRSYLTYFVLPRKFLSDGEPRAQVSTFFVLQLIIAGFTLFIWKICALPKMCFFNPENEVMTFPKIKIKWDWVSDVYIKSNAVIWFWRYCHVRTRQTSENQITDRKCVVQTNSRVKWRWFYSGMSEFNCLVVVLFSAMFSCFLLDSFELQEMVCVTKHGATFSSLNISRRYDEHACDTIFFFLCWKLKN